MNSFGLPAKVGQLEALKYSQIESNLYSVSFAQIKSFSPCDKIDIDRQSSFEKSNLDTDYNETRTKKNFKWFLYYQKRWISGVNDTHAVWSPLKFQHNIGYHKF